MRNGDSLEGTFLAQNVHQYAGIWSRLIIAVQVDHIVEIARPGTFTESPNLFAEGFLVGLTEHFDAAIGRIAVWVEYRFLDGWHHHHLISGQIKFILGRPPELGETGPR